MARRRLSQQQIRRIREIQKQRRQQSDIQASDKLADTDSQPLEGRVIIRHGRSLIVEGPDKQLTPCLFRQNLGDIVCGDRVIWLRTGINEGVVTAVKARISTLARPDYSGHTKPLAANLTQLVIVIAPEPAPTGYLLDQYLVTAETIGVDALILINKIELLDNKHPLNRIHHYFEDIGYPIIKVSSKQHINMQQFQRALKDQTSILVGQSGVGKSSLGNSVVPDLQILTGKLSATTGMGKHTTSSATLYDLPGGGSLIDSPGVRSFRLTSISQNQLEHGFREFHPYLGRCKFSDCSHQHEPGCALIAAAEAGKIADWRLQHFLLMAKELEKQS